MNYYDSHNHLQDTRLSSVLPELATEYAQLGVKGVVVNGVEESDWGRVGELSQLHSFVQPAFGLHPWFIKERSDAWLERLEHCLDTCGGSIVEVGLDKWVKDYDLEDQVSVFIAQLQLAAERNLPLSIHCLKAWGTLLEVLESNSLPEKGFLLHSYGGSSEMIKPLVQLGAHFSFCGNFLAHKKSKLHQVFRQIPLDRILVETDAPDQALPQENETHPLIDNEDGSRLNHPANIVAIYQGLADILGMPVEDLEKQVEKNFKRLFL